MEAIMVRPDIRPCSAEVDDLLCLGKRNVCELLEELHRFQNRKAVSAVERQDCFRCPATTVKPLTFLENGRFIFHGHNFVRSRMSSTFLPGLAPVARTPWMMTMNRAAPGGARKREGGTCA